jgi:hypothetical protein
MSMKKNNYSIIVAAGLGLTIVLSSVFIIEGTRLTFVQGLDQQRNMSMMDSMNDKMMMKDVNMNNTATMSNMMMPRMMDMMDRMNRMMDMMMMMMDMPMDTNNSDMVSMSNGNNINMGSMQNQTGDIMG